MSVDLNALAHQIANELAKGDLARPSPGAAPPVRIDGVATPPRGVVWVSDSIRLAELVDHTLLDAEATRADVERHCAEAAELGFAAVCVWPLWVALCRSLLAGTRVRVATLIGHPTGAQRSETKAVEARLATDDGADELDVAVPLGIVRNGEWSAVGADVATVVRAAQGRLVKLVVDTAALAPAEIVRTAVVAREEGAGYVKTSSGAHPAGGATPEAVALLRLVCGDALGVAASGAVADREHAARLIAAGATRIGTSQGAAIADCLVPGPLPLAELFGGAPSDGGRSRDRQTGRPGAPGPTFSGTLP